MAVYPGGIKTWTPVTNNLENVDASHINGAYEEIIAVETELDVVKAEVDVLVVVGDSSVEAAQARVNADAYTFDTLKARLDDSDAKLADIVYMSSFPRLNGETDDTQRLQRAIDSFTGNIAGAIQIAGDLRISSTVTCNKTGLRLIGVSNRKSRIISTYADVALLIKPLYNGNPYTSVSYCKFHTDNIAICAEGDAITSGTGLWLQWIYASSFTNLYTSGFAKHIVMKGAHLNTFYNLYQGNMDSSVTTLALHNRGVGLSADGTLDEAGESSSNNNHIIGGWINNTSWDLTSMPGTITQCIDIEPASNSFILGKDCVFRDIRAERMDYYVIHGALYSAFPWFIFNGDNCKMINIGLNQSGASQSPDYPVYQVNSNYNKIEIADIAPYNYGLISFGATAEGNIVEYNAIYNDYQTTLLNAAYKTEWTSIKYNNLKNRFIFKDNKAGTIADVVGSNTKAQGEFTCRSSKNTNIVNSGDYTYQGCVSAAVDIPLPIGRTTGSTAFTKITLNTDTSNRRMLLATANGQAVTAAGVVTLTALVYIPSASSTYVSVGVGLNCTTTLIARDKWITIRSRMWMNIGDKILPTLQMLGVSGDIFYVGEISVCDGNTSVYIPNNTYNAVSASF